MRGQKPEPKRAAPAKLAIPSPEALGVPTRPRLMLPPPETLGLMK